MHILLVADGRSPITRRWQAALLKQGLRVSLISTFPCAPLPDLQHFAVIPVAFSRFAAQKAGATASAASPSLRSRLRPLIERFRDVLLIGRYYLGPFSVERAAPTYLRALAEIQPDLVHALRIPYEGMLARHTPTSTPLIVSIWGNDLTLHAHGSPWMARLTCDCLRRADGLMADARRDLRLAREWGLAENAPMLVVPGSGGLDLSEIGSRHEDVSDLIGTDVSPETPLIINPRGFRVGSVRNDTFFQALPELFRQIPQAVVVCPAMAGQPEALRWIQRLGLDNRVRLLPQLPQPRLWDLFHRAQVLVTPSQHDGTPNSLLEAMACGCFPVAGDIESIREWITPGLNGLLIDPADPAQLASALITAASDADLRQRAAAANSAIISARADVCQVGEQVRGYYEHMVSLSSPNGRG